MSFQVPLFVRQRERDALERNQSRGALLDLDELLESGWLAFEQKQEVAHWHADHGRSALVFLKCAGTTTENLLGLTLGEPQLFSNLSNPLGGHDALYSTFELRKCELCRFGIGTRHHGIIAVLTVPVGLTSTDGPARIGPSH